MSAPRFVWLLRGQGDRHSLWEILDTETPGAEAGQAVCVATAHTAEAAKMMCLALNGSVTA